MCCDIADHPRITLHCDGQGCFCCSSDNGSNAPRCGGEVPGLSQHALER